LLLEQRFIGRIEAYMAISSTFVTSNNTSETFRTASESQCERTNQAAHVIEHGLLLLC
jgi:hypothetical protein